MIHHQIGKWNQHSMKTRLVMSLAVLLGMVGISTSAWAAPLAYSIHEFTQNLVTIDLSNGGITVIGATGGGDIDGLALSSSGVLYGSDNNNDTLVVLDRSTGAITSSVALSVGISDSGLAFDSAGTLYLADDSASDPSGEVQNLFTVDPVTGNMTLVGVGDGDVTGIAFNSSGTLLGIEPETDTLVTFNLGNGATTAIGSLGFDADDEQGLTFVPSSSLLYMVDEASESLYSVNSASGAATFIANLGDDYEALAYVPIPAAVWLFGSGLLGLIGIARRKKTT